MAPDILEKFKKEARKIAKAKKDPRFLHAIGKLKRAGFLDAPTIPPYGGPVGLEDVLWAGKYEPRALEVLPAILVNRPKLLRIQKLPKDLESVLQRLKTGMALKTFRGIPPQDYSQWIKAKGKLKTFRFSQSDLKLLSLAKESLSLKSDIETIRHALRLAATSEKVGQCL